MARIRTVKPEFFTHYALFAAEQETGLPLRVAFAGLWTQADREGRFRWIPPQLKLGCLPYDEVDFSRVLDALRMRGFIVKYACKGAEFGVIPSFTEHQVINNREKSSSLPAPTLESIEAARNKGSTREPRVNDAHATPLEHAQAEGKGREQGKEQDKNHMSTSDEADETPDSQQRRDHQENPSPGDEEIPAHKSPGRSDPGAGKVPPDPEKPNKFGQQADEIFAYWARVMSKQSSTKFTTKRRKAVINRLKEGYTQEDICQAIEGCARSPHHMGQNDSGTVYDDLELICRTGDKLENFMTNIGRVIPAQFPSPSPANTAGRHRLLADVVAEQNARASK